MFRLTLAGPDTAVLSSLCGACPYGPRGCCVAPPRYAWSDVARVVLGGGRDWLLATIARGELAPFEHGLRVRRQRGEGEGDARCTFHDDARGCTIAPGLRPSTCNYYVCEPAYEAGVAEGAGDEVGRAREGTTKLVSAFVAWDEALLAFVSSREGGAVGAGDAGAVDATFLDDLAATFERLRASR